MKKRVWNLYRVSTGLQGAEGDDIPMQKTQCRDFAAKQGWTVTREFSEKISGYKTDIQDRETLNEIKIGAKQRDFDVLLMYMSDRLGRQMEYSLFIRSLYDLGIEVWSVKEGELRSEEHTDSLLNFIRYWQAEGESKKTSVRIKDTLRLLNEEGEYYVGGTPPFGYQIQDTGIKRNSKNSKTLKRLVPNPDEARIVRLIFDMVTERALGSSRIAQELNSLGFTNRGNIWRYPSLLKMLRNPAYMGYKRYGQQENVGRGQKVNLPREQWKVQPFNATLQIISEAQWRKVQEILDSRNKRSPYYQERSRVPSAKTNTLLAGLVVCGYCGKKLGAEKAFRTKTRIDGTTHTTTNHRYYCSYSRNDTRTHAQRAFGAKKIDQEIEKKVLSTLSELRLESYDSESDSINHSEIDIQKLRLKELKKQLNDVDFALSNMEDEFQKIMMNQSKLTTEFVAKQITFFETKKLKLEEEIAKVKDEISRIEEKSTDIIQFNEMLEDWEKQFKNNLDMTTKKRLLSEVVKEVVISKETLRIVFNISLDSALQTDRPRSRCGDITVSESSLENGRGVLSMLDIGHNQNQPSKYFSVEIPRIMKKDAI